MAAGGGREPSLGELADDVAEIKAMAEAINTKIDSLPYLRVDVYEARHAGLRSEIALEMKGVKQDVIAVRGISENARTLAMWALGVLVVAVVGAIVTFAVSGGPT